jgi:DNA-binding CsgD family transcriptional regulator
MLKNIDLSHDMLISQHLGGIKLIRPDTRQPTHQHSSLLSIGETLNASFNVFFLNHDSIFEETNEANWSTSGFASKLDALGSTIAGGCHNKEQVLRVHANNDMVMKSEKMLIFDEQAELIEDKRIHAVSVKFPWYDKNDNVVGVFGCGIRIEQDSLSSLAEDFSFVTERFIQINKTMKSLLPGKKIGKAFLTTREYDVFKLVMHGKTMRQIGNILNLSHRTVETYFSNIKNKIGVSTKSQLFDYILNESNEVRY